MQKHMHNTNPQIFTDWVIPLNETKRNISDVNIEIGKAIKVEINNGLVFSVVCAYATLVASGYVPVIIL